MTSNHWPTPPAGLTIAAPQVHIWRVALDRPGRDIQHLKQLLSADEQHRAARFHFHRDQRRYIVARGALRRILARYLQRTPDALRFDYTTHGKPFLPRLNLEFNVTHSHEIALIGLAPGRAIGVDIEYKGRVIEEAAAIAARFFSPHENIVFRQIPLPQQQEAFYNCWTRKEAYIKAIGEGLSHPLDTFDVTFRPGDTARFLKIGDDPAELTRWTLAALHPHPDYIAALAVAGPSIDLRCFHFNLTDFTP